MLAAACRGMAHRAIFAPYKGHSHQGPGKDDVLQGTLKGRMFVKGYRVNVRGNNGIRD
jgi:hypothetical protein